MPCTRYVVLLAWVAGCASPTGGSAQEIKSKKATGGSPADARVASATPTPTPTPKSTPTLKPKLTPKALKPQKVSFSDCVRKEHGLSGMISGDSMARFVPSVLGGVASHARQVYAGKIIAAFAVRGGWANLDVGGNVSSVSVCMFRACKTPVEVGGKRACMNKSADRYGLTFLFGGRIVLTLSAPDESTVMQLLGSINLTGLARLAASS